MKRSTSQILLGALGLVAAFAAACARSTGVVEAPMMDANASASALALAGRPVAAAEPRDALDLPFRPGDRWSGTYTCRQGLTEMAIIFEDVSGSKGGDRDEGTVHVEATFEFRFPGSSVYPASDGSARMSGSYDPKSRRLRLVGEEWLEQVPGYALVNLVGSVTSRGSGRRSLSYSGTVEGQGCTSFSVRAEDPLDIHDEKAGSRPPPPRSLPRPRP